MRQRKCRLVSVAISLNSDEQKIKIALGRAGIILLDQDIRDNFDRLKASIDSPEDLAAISNHILECNYSK